MSNPNPNPPPEPPGELVPPPPADPLLHPYSADVTSEGSSLTPTSSFEEPPPPGPPPPPVGNHEICLVDEGGEEAREVRRRRRKQRREAGAERAAPGGGEEPPRGLSVVIQGPDGQLYIGTEDMGRRRGAGGRVPEGTFEFAPEARGKLPALSAVHIILPPPLRELERAPPGGVLLGATPPPIPLSVYDSAVHLRRKRTFIFLLLLGVSFDTVSFIVSMVERAHKGSGGGALPGVGDSATPPPTPPTSAAYLSSPLFSTDSTASAVVYLALYLLLDMIGFFGAWYDRASAITWYVVAQTIATGLAALAKLHPFLIFRIITIMIAFQVRQGLVQMRHSAGILRVLERNMGGGLPVRAEVPAGNPRWNSRGRMATFFPWVVA